MMTFKSFLTIATTTLLTASSYTLQDKTVENPLIEMANTTTLDITRVELTDTATTLYVDAYFTPHYWIKIASESYLQTEGKKYKLTGTQGLD